MLRPQLTHTGLGWGSGHQAWGCGSTKGHVRAYGLLGMQEKSEAWEGLGLHRARLTQDTTAGGPEVPSSHLGTEMLPEGWTLLLATGRWLLAESGERRLVGAQTEGLGVGFAWKVWGGPWLGKSEQGAA